ncbi:hypothetical protein ACFO4O_16650 [Glaciecola siphonariae]|uniref:DNA gyrase subunit B n=1 Tax=Glaciecola siphonariae TaxID=521012 RepID=A0ABV9M2A2_9ALTE
MSINKQAKAVNAILSLLIAALLLSYPFVVYRFVETIEPMVFAAVLFIAGLLRFLVLGKTRQGSDYLILIAVGFFCACVVIINSEQILKFYPVLMNVAIGTLFITSLKNEHCLIEKFAHLSKKKPPPEAKGYLRSLSLAWGLLLITNGIVSAYTAWYTSLAFWALYNGVLSYVLIALFAACEYLYRGHYKRKNGIIDE